jgi:hypothetical protein
LGVGKYRERYFLSSEFEEEPFQLWADLECPPLESKTITDPILAVTDEMRFQEHLRKLSEKKDRGIRISRADLWYA